MGREGRGKGVLMGWEKNGKGGLDGGSGPVGQGGREGGIGRGSSGGEGQGARKGDWMEVGRGRARGQGWGDWGEGTKREYGERLL